MNFIRDIQNKILFGSFKFKNLKEIKNAESSLVIDKQGNLGKNIIPFNGEGEITEQWLNNSFATKTELNTKVDKVSGKSLSDNNYTTNEKSKLASLQNYDPTPIENQINNKVDKQEGYGLSETSFTQEEKLKLSTISDKYAGRFTSLTDLNSVVGVPGGYAYVSIDNSPTVLYAWNNQLMQWESTILATSEETSESIKTKYEANPDTNVFTDLEKTKLSGIATQATKNDTDTNLKNRANHTGTQPISSVEGLNMRLIELDNIVEEIIGVDNDQSLIIEDHKNRKDNPHEVTKAQIGLALVDNTSDINKPISTATATALSNKANNSHIHNISDITGLSESISEKQPNLVSGVNIKTINGESILGSGNIEIESANTGIGVGTTYLDTNGWRVADLGPILIATKTKAFSTGNFMPNANTYLEVASNINNNPVAYTTSSHTFTTLTITANLNEGIDIRLIPVSPDQLTPTSRIIAKNLSGATSSRQGKINYVVYMYK